MNMITTIPNTMQPRFEFTAPDTGKHWLYFEYDGTYHGYKEMPLIIKKDEKFYVKTGHNSDTLNVAYREIPKEDIVFKV